MSTISSGPLSTGWIAALRRFVQGSAPAPAGRCDMCGAVIDVMHRHLLDVSKRALLCCCGECAVVFGRGSGNGTRDGNVHVNVNANGSDGSGSDRGAAVRADGNVDSNGERNGNPSLSLYRLVPTRVRQFHASHFTLTDAQWDALQIPIGIAFFFKSTPQARVVALYPGPAGVTESLLDLSAWDALQADNPVLAELEPDVETLLVDRTDGARAYYRAPIDRCYALAGLIRTRWQGVTGGADARAAIRAFFAELQADALSAPGSPHA